MDAKVFRMAILTIISAFILVLVIVYATNADKINRLFGKDRSKEPSTEAASVEESGEEVIYGDQIGDSLDAFLLDEDFFDETEKIPSVVVRKKTATSSSDSESEVEESQASGEEDEPQSTGKAVVGELFNPNPQATTDISGYLTSLPEAPPGGYGQYIPSDQTITGTQVGTP